jgi:hypothetical protein
MSDNILKSDDDNEWIKLYKKPDRQKESKANNYDICIIDNYFSENITIINPIYCIDNKLSPDQRTNYSLCTLTSSNISSINNKLSPDQRTNYSLCTLTSSNISSINNKLSPPPVPPRPSAEVIRKLFLNSK